MQPPLRWSELTSNSTRYDRAIAAPSDNELVLMWSVYSVILLADSIVVSVVFLAVILDRKARTNPFNAYLLFLMLPDFLYSFLCFITCLLSAIAGHYWSEPMCRWQSWYLTFGLGANSWLNAVIAYEIHQLLLCSDRRIRYQPPSLRRVTRNSLLVYLLVALLGLWGSIPLPENIPIRLGVQGGFVCQPFQDGQASALLLWLIYYPLYFIIPYIYVAWVVYDILYRSKLFPPPGKRRLMAVYFFRIIACFALLWGPAVIIFYALRGVVSPWVTWASGVLAHTQGMVSAGLSLMKPDIAKATRKFLRCQCCPERGAKQSHGEENQAGRRSKLLDFGFGISRALNRSSSTVMEPCTEERPCSNTDRDEDTDSDNDQSFLAPQNDDFQFEDEVAAQSRDFSDSNPAAEEAMT